MLSRDLINQTNHDRLRPLRDITDKSKILVHEIYASIQGESSYMGQPCVFVRTTGCHLRCSYCDTAQAFFTGRELSIEEIIHQVKSYKINLVELTGGEPLLQKPCLDLVNQLVSQNYTVLIETSGAVSIKHVNQQAKIILDIKTPASGESHKNVWSNLKLLWPGCEVKFVISSMRDYYFAKEVCLQYRLFERTHVLFSPNVSMIPPQILAEQIIKDKLPVRFQLQLHKILYGDAPGK